SVILDSIYRSINESTTNKIYSLSLHDALPICRGAAVHAAVVDAGEHDEARDRVELEGHGQEQRHGQRRSDAGQDADDGAQRDAQEGPQQVLPGERDGEAVEEGLERLDQRVLPRRSVAAPARGAATRAVCVVTAAAPRPGASGPAAS